MFIVGQKVVCVNDVFPAWVKKIYTQLPTKNVTYTVRGVGIGRKADAAKTETFLLLLAEISNPPDPTNKYGEELGFDADRFAPLDELTEEQIESVSEPEFVPSLN